MKLVNSLVGQLFQQRIHVLCYFISFKFCVQPVNIVVKMVYRQRVCTTDWHGNSLVRVIIAVLCLGVCAADPDFLPEFQFGAGTSSYQIEGAANGDGKVQSIWDHYIHEDPRRVRDGSNGDIACNSYHQWQEDVDAAVEMGLDFYRFSISWARLLPTGFTDNISKDGVDYYNRVIDGLLEKGIQPVVTIYHWDLPVRLQKLGGWTNPLISNWFADYARLVYSLYADRVKTWITINEPFIMCDLGYAGFFAPGISDLYVARYICSKNVLLAHAKAWRVYDEEYRAKFNGQISLTNQILWTEPYSEDPADVLAAELAAELIIGRFSHPIFSKEGGWPPVLEKMVAQKSKEEGLAFSRLPEFTKEERELVKGSYDYYGLNYYTGRLTRVETTSDKPASIILEGDNDMDFIFETHPEWKQAANSWFKVYAKGLRHAMQWITKKYGDQKIFITEVGYSTEDVTLEDHDRVEFYKDYLKQVSLAIKEDKINILGFTAWSLIDNFEWLDGYKARFGLYAVNFTDPRLPRAPRLSSKYYASVIKTRSLDHFSAAPEKYTNDEL